jgi:hypothetical protein
MEFLDPHAAKARLMIELALKGRKRFIDINWQDQFVAQERAPGTVHEFLAALRTMAEAGLSSRE